MTTQLPPRDRSDVAPRSVRESPEVLFEEARRRRRRRWAAGGALTAALLVAAGAALGMAGGGGRSGTPHGGRVQPAGSGSGANSSSHVNADRLFPGAPATQPHGVYPGTACELAPRNRYLPARSGCVTASVADVTGNGHPDLVLIYSRLAPLALHGLPPRRVGGSGRVTKLYEAEQAMLRIVTPDGQVATTRLQSPGAGRTAYPVTVAALLSIAHVNEGPAREIFLQTGESSSGLSVLAYSLYKDRLISAGVGFASGGDSASGDGFECLRGNPPRVIERNYQLIHGIKVIHGMIFGLWREQVTALIWHGPRLALASRRIYRRRLLPKENIGAGCIRGI